MAKIKTGSARPKNTRKALGRILSYLGSFRIVISIVLLMSFLSNILALKGPRYAGLAINAISKGKGSVDFDGVFFYAERMLVCYVVSSLVIIFIKIIMMKISKGVALRMRKDIFDKLMKLPVSFFDGNRTGDIISRVSYDVDVVCTCLSTDVVSIITSLVSVLGSLYMMIVISPYMSILVVVTIPLSVCYTVYMRKRIQPRYSRRSISYGAMNSYVEEIFTGQKTIQSYAYEEVAEKRFDRVNGDASNAYYEADFYGTSMGPTMGMISNITLSLIGIIGSLFFMLGSVTIGQISSFVLYSRKFSGPINEIANAINELFSALAASERIFDLLDQKEELPDSASAIKLEDVKGDVALDNVSFDYDRDRIILHSLSLTAPRGKVTAIVGPTGAGKTTIMNLLMRFYDPNDGSILVDGRDIRSYTRSSLRSAYAMVLQDTWLFRGTVYENIAYGKIGATMDEVVSACKRAHIHPFIMRLENGYNTIISEDGGNISKGQKQLLTIARAMLYDAKILILDEATSNVDTTTEKDIQNAMLELMNGKTCFIIAHRLSTIQHADNILVLDNGDVVEMGRHRELMEKKGYYYNLYSAQYD